MTQGLLFDSHALLWYTGGSPMSDLSQFAIGQASATARLFASHLSIWEMGVAGLKRRIHLVPDRGGRTPVGWFTEATARCHATQIPISAEIAGEASLVPAVSGYGDPGDCFLIATCRIHDLALVTRDKRILKLAGSDPGYLSVIPC